MQGFKDSYRKLEPDSSHTLSWFDYRSKAFEDEPKRGLRIDHIEVRPAKVLDLATSPVTN